MKNLCFTARATADKAVLYWDKPEDADANAEFTILLNGEFWGSTSKTHIQLESLTPDSAYEAVLLYNEKAVDSLSFRTAKIRRRIDVTAAPYFAVGDGATMNTQALQQAICDCREDAEVYFPAGTYLTGALDLHSDLAMYLDEGATLQGSDDPADYLPRIWSRFEGTEQECYRSLLNAGHLDHTHGPSCENILLYGFGTISGGGRVLADRIIETERERLKDYLAENAALVSTCENDRTIPGRVRGRLINLSNCAHVRITGLTLQNGASWNVHMVYSDDIVTDHCVLRSSGIWNGDGWDPDSSTNCTLFATEFQTEDDSVAIKSGKNPEGNEINRPTKHIRVFDCKSVCGHGICIGSEMSGGVEDVQIWDCEAAICSNGIEIKGTPKRGGYVRNISVRDCTFPRLLVHAVPYNDDGIPAPAAPIFENFSFEHLTLTGQCVEHNITTTVKPIEIVGFPQPGYEVRDVKLVDCALPVDADIHISRCRNLTMEGLCSQ